MNPQREFRLGVAQGLGASFVGDVPAVRVSRYGYALRVKLGSNELELTFAPERAFEWGVWFGESWRDGRCVGIPEAARVWSLSPAGGYVWSQEAWREWHEMANGAEKRTRRRSGSLQQSNRQNSADNQCHTTIAWPVNG